MQKRAWIVAIGLALWFAGVAPAQNGVTVMLNFDGISADGTAPPDTSGRAGATQFVQWVNTQFAVYDKNTGVLLQSPRPGNSLWQGFGGPCETMNSGLPMIEYDKTAGRWVLAQLALSDPAFYCFAVSTSSDATQTYYRYAFPLPAGMHPDTPRLAVWPDAYYASFNLHPVGKPAAPLVAAYDRTNMLVGATARGPVTFQPAARVNLLPSDFDGSLAPAPGEPDFYLEVGGANLLRLFQFHVNFANIGSSTFRQTGTVPVQSVGLGCSRNPPAWKSGVISQPPSGNGVKLDAWPDQLMYRLAWRNVNNVEHLVANQTVIVADNPVVAGAVWYDIVNPAGVPALAQQGTVSDPATSYWIGSLAQDKDGDLALGLNASSTSVYPSVALSGRLVSDPPGTMFPPFYLVTGGGAQSNTSKWGTHADMSVDPVNDCALWFTAEYVKTGNPHTFDWATRITQFRFTSCQ